MKRLILLLAGGLAFQAKADICHPDPAVCPHGNHEYCVVTTWTNFGERYCEIGAASAVSSATEMTVAAMASVAGKTVTGSGSTHIYQQNGCDGIDQTGDAKSLALLDAENSCGFPNDPTHLQQLTAFTAYNETIADGSYGYTCQAIAYADFQCL